MNDVIDQLHADCLEAREALRACFEAARARVAAWEPAPMPTFAVPGSSLPVEQLGARPVGTPGARLFSLVPCVLSVAGPMVAGIYFGRFVTP